MNLSSTNFSRISHIQVIAFGVLSESQVELPKGFTNPDQIRVIPDPVHYDSLKVLGKNSEGFHLENTHPEMTSPYVDIV